MAVPLVLMGGWLSNPQDYLGLARILAGPPYRRLVYLVDFRRAEWLRLRDPDFRPALDALAATVDLARAETGSDQVDLLGHSAGGRIARAYLGDRLLDGPGYGGHQWVRQFTTLGTAHTTVEVFVAQFGAWMNAAYPGAFYSYVTYRSIAGETVRGRRLGLPEEMLAFRSYELTCGSGATIGDGVIPTASCYLPGAKNLILRGARHAPYTAAASWYGAPAIVAAWYS